MKVRAWIAAVSSVVCAVCASADTLVLKEGDRLHGNLADISSGIVSFRTELAGKVFVPLSEVEELSTTKFVIVEVNSEKLLPGRIVHENDAYYVVASNGRDRREINLDDVTSVASVPESQVESPSTDTELKPDPKLEGALDTGYRFRQGTEDYSGPTAELNLRHEGDGGEVSARVQTEYAGDAPSFQRFFEADLRATLNAEGPWKPNIMLEFERNRSKALDLRSTLTLGMKRRLVDRENWSIDGDAGVGGAFERFDEEPLRDDQGRRYRHLFGDDSLTESELNLRLGLRYNQLIFGGLTLEEGIILRPSLTDLGDIRARWTSTLKIPITRWLHGKIDFIVDYEDDTKFGGIDEWHSAVGAAIGVKF